MRQQKRATAEQQARKDIAEAQYRGDVGVKEKERDTRIQSAQYEADAVEYENERNVEVAKSNAMFHIQEADYQQKTRVAQIEAEKAAQMRDMELQKEVEHRKISQQTELIRSQDYSKAVVGAESKERCADADLYTAQRDADAKRYNVERQADSGLFNQQRDAEAILYQAQKEAEGKERLAEAAVYAAHKEAEGIQAVLDAQASGLENLLASSGDPATVLQYLMVKEGTYEHLAESTANAVKGLNPKITHWTTTSGDSDPVTDLIKKIPIMADTIHKQTGMKPPSWLINMDDKPSHHGD